jgi:hypothetical protein
MRATCIMMGEDEGVDSEVQVSPSQDAPLAGGGPTRMLPVRTVAGAHSWPRRAARGRAGGKGGAGKAATSRVATRAASTPANTGQHWQNGGPLSEGPPQDSGHPT